MHRVHFRHRHARNGGHRPSVIGLSWPLLVDGNVSWIGPDDQQIAARLDTSMPRASRQHDDISRLDEEHLPFDAAELHLGAASCNAKHLVRRGMKVQERIDAVAPAASPTVPGKGTL